MNNLLTICIPTYNRSVLLQEGLHRLIPLVSKYQIPIVISDNASDDDTEAVSLRAKARYPQISYFRNSENLGMDKNFELALKRAQTNFAWLLSDDDRITERSIMDIIVRLQTVSCDLLLLNGGSPDPGRGRVTNKFECSYTYPPDFMRDLGWHTTWMSGLVFSKKLIFLMDFNKFNGSYFTHVGGVFDAMARMPIVNIQWIQFSCFYPSASAEFSWSSNVLEVFSAKWSQTIFDLPNYYPTEVKRECVLAHSRHTRIFAVSGLLNLRAQGAINRANISFHKNDLRHTTTVHPFVLLLIASIPAAPLGILRSAYIILRRLAYGYILRH